MTKLTLSILSTLLLSTAVWAQSPAQNSPINSLSQAILEMVDDERVPHTNSAVTTPYSHESEKYNSLARGALAKQQVSLNLRLNSASKVDYSRYTETSEKNKYNALSHGALAK